MKHKNYYEINARDNYELGLKTGEIFGTITRNTIEKRKKSVNWKAKTENAKKYFDVTKKYFPQYIEEINGYAIASHILFEDLWTLMTDVGMSQDNPEKCTTFVTNNGKTISHNEDWEKDSENDICVLKKTIKDTTILELYYFNTLGGVSISVNSHGYVQAINTLDHTGNQIGVPRNIIARWLSETKDIEKDFEKLVLIPRANGYNHVVVNRENIWDLECTASQQILLKPPLPFIHTNHYLSKRLKTFEETENLTHTFQRYEKAKSLVKNKMSMEEIMKVNSDISKGPHASIMNERTIAKMIIDLKNKIAKIWLKRAAEKNWVDYSLDFL
ncbi:hypothetical protein HZC27_03800 [Candidatus Roizmanbacteria bacterium]|nr:hypothetical protein [Candidatus Roizmanbacteria bacterium]